MFGRFFGVIVLFLLLYFYTASLALGLPSTYFDAPFFRVHGHTAHSFCMLIAYNPPFASFFQQNILVISMNSKLRYSSDRIILWNNFNVKHSFVAF